MTQTLFRGRCRTRLCNSKNGASRKCALTLLCLTSLLNQQKPILGVCSAFTSFSPIPNVARTRASTGKAFRSKFQINFSASTIEGPAVGLNTSCVLSDEEVAPLIRFKKGPGKKEKVINAFGVWTLLVTIVTAPIWAAAMWAVGAFCDANPDFDPDRSLYDKTGKIWSKVWLSMNDSYPTVSGDMERLKVKEGEFQGESCLFVANHASWLDIPVLCTVLAPVFKFIAKGELRDVPCIGQQLIGGNHILIDREDRRSQLRTFKEGVAWLKKGVPLMAFPEGKRSPDGKLMEFKGGIFSMAIKSNVPIVPISVSNTHAIMPANALFPVQSGAGKLHVHVHSPIHVENKTEQELESLVRNALLSNIPIDQHPDIPKIPEEEMLVDEDVKGADVAANAFVDSKEAGLQPSS